MADSNEDTKFHMGKFSKPLSQRPPRNDQDFSKRPPTRAPVNKDNIQISCRATNPLSLKDDLSKVFQDPTQAKATTATRLFRNDELFDATRAIVADFIRSGRSGKFSMWSSGCSSGEEVYSMAMIAMYEYEKAKRPIYLEAFGTDINDQRIAEGRLGRYGRPGKDAFGANYWNLLKRYAAMNNSEVQMSDQLRTICRFMKFDMRNRPKKHTFQFIVCNHVLQYYDAPGQQHIIGNLISVLKPGGRMYLEGLTDQGIAGLNLTKLEGSPYLYKVG